MATFYDSLPLNVIKKLVKMELVETCETTGVEIKAIEFDDNIYGYDEDPKLQELNQMLTVTANIEGATKSNDNGEHPWLLEWSADMGQFTSVMRDDQDEDVIGS